MRRLQFSGYPAILVNGVALTGPVTQRHRLALLAVLSLSPDRSLPRDKIFALLWPDSDAASARHLLNTSVHVLRRAVGEDFLITRRDEVALGADVEVDVLEFAKAMTRGDLESATRHYRAPLLDGFFLDGAAEFEQWQSRERARLAARHRDALEALAEHHDAAGHLPAALQWWRRLNQADPYNTRVVMRLMLALERMGDHGNALELAREHETLLTRELEADSSAEFRELVTRIRDRPNGIPADAFVPPDAVASAGRGDPVRRAARRRWTSMGVVALVTAAGITAWILAPWPSAPPSRVMIEEFENLGGDTSLAIVGVSLRDALTRAASEWSLIEVLVPTATSGQGVRVTARPGGRLRAGTIISGSYSLVADSIRVEARVVSHRDGRVIRGVRASWPRSSAGSTEAADFASSVLGALAMAVDDRMSAVSTAEHSDPTFAAYQEFVIGLEHHGKAEHSEAAERFRRALTADPQFSLAAVWLGRALYHGARFAAAESLARSLDGRSPPLPDADRRAVEWILARFRGDGPGAYRAARHLVDLAPRSPWVLTLASEALSLRRAAEARALVAQLHRENEWVRGWSELVSQLGNALHLLGAFDEESALARSDRTTATNLFVRLINEARPLAAQGRLAEINQLIDDALSLSDQPALEQGSIMQRVGVELLAHGHQAEAAVILERGRAWYEAQLRANPGVTSRKWGLANTLVRLGELDSARQVLEEMHERDPRMYSIRGLMAVVAVRQGDVAAAQHFDSLLSTPDTNANAFDDALRLFWRARAASRRGDSRRAILLLQESVARGVPMPLDSAHIETDLHALRGEVAFDDLTRLRR